MSITSVAGDIVAEIRDLKAGIGATILAHYYQESEIQELADYTGLPLNDAGRQKALGRRLMEHGPSQERRDTRLDVTVEFVQQHNLLLRGPALISRKLQREIVVFAQVHL
jgi:hypothetical protein